MGDNVEARIAEIEDWVDDYGKTSPGAVAHLRYLLDLRREERSWRGLIAFLDEHYPEDVFLPNPKAPDQGPRIIWMTRQIARVRDLHQDDDKGWCTGCEYAYPCPTVRALDGEVPS